MLVINIAGEEYWDEKSQLFAETKSYEVRLEHSLYTMSKWEAKWHKPFLTSTDKTMEETEDYIICMSDDTLTLEQLRSLPSKYTDKIHEYINDPMTATTIYEPKDQNGGGKKETITTELVYYWMISLNIPLELEHWHFNRLYTLIRVCSIKNEPPKKGGKPDIAKRKELNAQRLAAAKAAKAQKG